MLNIHGLPNHVKYHDLKVLVRRVCNINPQDFTLDDLNSDGGNKKKVRIAVADEKSRAHLIECLDGYHMDGQVLRVVPVGNVLGNPQHYHENGNNYPLRNDYRPDRPRYKSPEMRSSQSGSFSRPIVTPGRPLELQSHHESIRGPASVNLDPMRIYPGTVDMRLNRGQSGPLIHQSSKVGQASRKPSQVHPVAGQSSGDIWEKRSQWENYSQTRLPQQHNYGYQDQQGNTPLGQEQKITRKDDFQRPQFVTGGRDSTFLQGHREQNVLQDNSFLNSSAAYDKPSFGGKYIDSGPDPKRLKTDIHREYDQGPRFSPRRDLGRRESPAHDHRVESSPCRAGSPLHRDKPSSTYSYGSRAVVKHARPAYDAPTQVPKHVSGYVKSIREDITYPITGSTQKNWQERTRMFTEKKDDDKRDSRPKFERETERRSRSPHGSRSPLRRHPLYRTPPRDRFTKRSVSPKFNHHPLNRSPARDQFMKQSVSPRRSWALEKRYSPELASPPPPPMWPGSPENDKYRGNLLENNRSPLWESPSYNNQSHHEIHTDNPEKRRHRKIRVRTDLGTTGILESSHVFASDVLRDDRSNDCFSAKETVFAQRDPKFEPRREFNYVQIADLREPRFDLRSEAKDPKFEPRREPKFEPRLEPRDLSFEPRVEPRELRRAPKFEPRVEDRDLKFEPNRKPKFEIREPQFEPRNENTFEKSDKEFDACLETRYESIRGFDLKLEPRREPLLESRETKSESRREPVFEPRDPKFELFREPNFKPKDPQIEQKYANLEYRKGLKFEPWQPTFEPRADDREPKFKAGFNQRSTGVEARQEINYRHADLNNIAQRNEIRDPSTDDTKLEFLRQRNSLHPDARCEKGDICTISRAPKSDFDKEFEDVYRRSLEFKQKVEKMRGIGDKRRGKSGERKPDNKQQENDARRQDQNRANDRGQQLRLEELKRSHDKDVADMKLKREKAVEEICQKILHKHSSELNLSSSQSYRLSDELKIALRKIFQEMFHDQDLSFIELVVKFNARFGATLEAQLFEDVWKMLPSSFKNQQETRNDPEIAATAAHMTFDNNIKQVPDWSVKTDPQPLARHVSLQEVIGMPSVVPLLPMPINPAMVLHELPMHQQIIKPTLNPPVTPLALPAANHNLVENKPQAIFVKPIEVKQSGYFNLFLCKDDFEPYSTTQSEYLKNFLVNQIIVASESSSGWTPDFTLKGLSQSVYRYELVARDDNTRDWILKLDFSNFSFFNVLVYTTEELWYERAAIWLPGHSKYRVIDPLQKLKFQNSHMVGVNVGKWKLVKKIETGKGTRLYVDMPPSSARALDKYKMLLSYELQKVSVFLKAVAVDKDTFDIGLKETSVNDENVIKNAINNSPMPSLGPDPNIIKISLKGNKSLNVDQARKIKERLIYHIFKYHQEKRSQKTDFVKFGFCLPGSFGVLPENSETRRWLEKLDLGKLYKHTIVVQGSGDASRKCITMNVLLKRSVKRDVINHAIILERLRTSNQGVKGLNFHLWKYLRYHITKDHKVSLAIDMDVESVDTLSKLKYKLDYIDEYQHQQTAVASYVRSYAKLEELVKKYKSELLLSDSYDVANMELESDPDDEIVFMGEVNNK